MRGKIAAVRGDWAGAERWFAQAVKQAPSIPHGYFDWGAMLFAKGDLAGAIAKLKLAHEKGPHFADPVELWGEVLMKQGDARGAIAKFEQAYKEAPNWGRLHLRWGEALESLSRRDEAREQYRITSDLGLSVGDRAELAKHFAAS